MYGDLRLRRKFIARHDRYTPRAGIPQTLKTDAAIG